MNETDFKDYYQHLVENFAIENVRNGDWGNDEAKELAKIQMKSLLPNELETTEHYIFSLFHIKLNMNVGNLWIQIQQLKTTKKAVLFDMEIFDVFQGKGFDKESLSALEDYLKSNNVTSLTLHVYATNPRDRNLYLQTGFKDMSFNMVKTLNTEHYVDKKVLILQKMNENKFKVFRDDQIKDYARENVEAGFWEESDALEKSRKEVDKLLPNGLDTENHLIFSLFEEDSNANVGSLWIHIRDMKKAKSVFIYYIEISENYRGRGLSTQALETLGKWCLDNKASKIGLHVFAKNKVARHVYQKFGFVDTNFNMNKEIL